MPPRSSELGELCHAMTSHSGVNTNTTKHIYRVPVIQVTTVVCVGDAMTHHEG